MTVDEFRRLPCGSNNGYGIHYNYTRHIEYYLSHNYFLILLSKSSMLKVSSKPFTTTTTANTLNMIFNIGANLMF
mgnify:CR=1 FL=1